MLYVGFSLGRYVNPASRIDFTDAALASSLVPVQCASLAPPAVKQNKCKSIPMTPRVTHTRLPEGRQDFKLHAEGKVRLGELTDLTVGLVGGLFSRKAQWTYPSRVDEAKDEVDKGAGVWNFPYS